MNTPQRPFRIPETVYRPALHRAKREGTTLTAKVIDWMSRYARGEGSLSEYEAGGRDVHADWELALDDVLPEEVAVEPQHVAAYIRALQTPYARGEQV